MIPLQRFAAGPRVLGLAIAVAGVMGAPKSR